MDIDLNEEFQELQEMAEVLRVPFACLHVSVEGHDKKEAFFGIPEESSSELTHPPLPSTSATSAVKHIRTTSSSGQGKTLKDCGNKVFGIASLVKPLIALLFCILVELQKVKDLNWDTPVCKMFNQFRMTRNKTLIDFDNENVKLKNMLFHYGGFAPLTDFLLALDETFMVSEEEFIKFVPLLTREYTRENGEGRNPYSTCNYIFLVLLLKEIFSTESLHDIMYRYIFNVFKMDFTTLNQNMVNEWEKKGVAVPGHRVSSRLDDPVAVPGGRYSASDIQFAAFGAHSCTNDIAKLFKGLLKANNDAEDEYHSVAHTFFYMQFGKRSLIGSYIALDSELLGCDSLNVYSRAEREKLSYTLGKSQGQTQIDNPKRLLKRIMGKEDENKSVEVHYKGATVDGFTCSLYLSVESEVLVICMANVTGPLDFTDYACHCVLQQIFNLVKRVKIIDQVRQEELPRARNLLGPIEQADQDVPALSDSGSSRLSHFVGVWQHPIHNIKYRIESSGTLVREGETVQSGTMRVRVLDDGKTLRIFPGEEEREFSGPDRRAKFADVEFTIQNRQAGPVLVGSGGIEIYEKC